MKKRFVQTDGKEITINVVSYKELAEFVLVEFSNNLKADVYRDLTEIGIHWKINNLGMNTTRIKLTNIYYVK